MTKQRPLIDPKVHQRFKFDGHGKSQNIDFIFRRIRDIRLFLTVLLCIKKEERISRNVRKNQSKPEKANVFFKLTFIRLITTL